MVRFATMAFLLLTVSFAQVGYEIRHEGNETVFRQYHICYSPLGEEKRFTDGCPEGYLEERPMGTTEKLSYLLKKVEKCRAGVMQKCFPECRDTDSSAKQECVRNCYALLGTCVDGALSEDR